MSARNRQIDETRRGVGLALATLDADARTTAYDGWLDPAGLARRLSPQGGDSAVIVRAATPLEPLGEGYGGEPGDARWVRLALGERAITSIPFRIDRARAAERDVVSRVVVRAERQRCCDAAKCNKDKVLVRVALELDERDVDRSARARRQLIVSEALVSFEEQATCAACGVAAMLAEYVGVPLEGIDPAAYLGTLAAQQEAALPPFEPLSAGDLAPWVLRQEGDVFVLRDMTSSGPREAARRELAATVVLACGAVVSWLGAWSAYGAGAWQRLAILGAVALVLSLAAYAMSRIAGYSAKYLAKSAAVLWLARDRLVISPWVTRSGAVVIAPEGRYGAALPLAEIHELTLEQRGESWTLGCRSEHGPYEIGSLESEAAARVWHAAIERLLASCAHAERSVALSRSGAALVVTLCVPLLGLVMGCETPVWTPPDAPLPTSTPAPVGSGAPPTGSVELPRDAPPVGKAPAAIKPSLLHDDVPAALAKAKLEGKALFVEVWAPWCHTCLSMQSFVLPDPAIVHLGDRVVFAAVDSDRPENATFVDKYAVDVWPTLYVLDAEGAVLGRWPGAASVGELHDFIVRSVDARDAGADPQGPLSALLGAKQAEADKRHGLAAAQYRRALERGGDGWDRKSEALLGLVAAESKQGHFARCATLGAEHAWRMDGAAIPTDFTYVVLACASEVRDPALAVRARAAVIARLEKHVAQPPRYASVDDRADALSLLAEVRRGMRDRAGARRALEEQISLLERAAATAPSPDTAATFDYMRLNTYLALGRGQDAVRMLEERVKQLPDSYEAPARLAEALIALKRWDRALVAVELAVSKSYGPRKLRYLQMRADVKGALGDRAGQREALLGLIAHFESLEGAHKKQGANKARADKARALLRKLGDS